MDFIYSDGPIIACSTNFSQASALNIVRLSGFKDFGSIGPLLSIDPKKIKPRYAHYCSILDKGVVIDDVVITFFPAPHSYNGENILEISVHGNPLLTQKIISLFIDKAKFELARPGEFSYRAMKNNKLSLSQVEGLDLILNANSEYALEQGRSFLSGELQELYQELLTQFLNHKAALEILTDFSDDVGDEQAREQLKNSFDALSFMINKLKTRVSDLNSDLLKPEIVLVGLPNAGKSSLFNSFLKNERAIISSEAGTTRDYIRERIFIENNYFLLVDTAGIRESTNNIEQAGILKSLELIKNAFFKILVINPFEWDDVFFKQISKIKFNCIVFTHSDMNNFNTLKDSMMAKLPKIPNWSVNLHSMHKSELIQSLESEIANHFNRLIKNKPILLERHIYKINNLANSLEEYTQVFKNEVDIGILAAEIRLLEKNINELIGIVSPNDVLRHIFTHFCIGK